MIRFGSWVDKNYGYDGGILSGDDAIEFASTGFLERYRDMPEDLWASCQKETSDFWEIKTRADLNAWLKKVGFKQNSGPAKVARAAFDQWEKETYHERMDGFNAKNREHIRTVTRRVWGWSYSRRLCIQRVTDKKGFVHCQKCKETVSKVYVDHIKPVGKLDSGYLERLFCPVNGLQALCHRCHQKKTKRDLKAMEKTNKCKTFLDTF